MTRSEKPPSLLSPLIIVALFGILALSSPIILHAGAKSCERSDTDCGKEPEDGDDCTVEDSQGKDVPGTVVISNGGSSAACDYAIAPSRHHGGHFAAPSPNQIQRVEGFQDIPSLRPSTEELTREELLQRIDQLEKEVARLKRLLGQRR